MFLRTSVLAMAALLLASAPTAAMAEDPRPNEIFLDGLSAVVGGSPTDEMSRSPLLVSDVLFQARILQIVRGEAGSVNAPPGDELLHQARRSAVFLRLLARKARSLKETVDPQMVASIRGHLAASAGGERALTELMDQAGYDESDLTRWIEDGVLASTQIRYVLDQARSETGSQNKAAETGPARRRAARELLQWLGGVLTEQKLRIIR